MTMITVIMKRIYLEKGEKGPRGHPQLFCFNHEELTYERGKTLSQLRNLGNHKESLSSN